MSVCLDGSGRWTLSWLDDAARRPVTGRMPLVGAAGVDIDARLDGAGASPDPRRAVVRFDRTSPGTAWLCHNVDALAGLADGELHELVAIPRHAAGYAHSGWFDTAPGRSAVMRFEMDRFWQAATSALGPLPWSRVQVIVGPQDWPLGLSFPGVVLLSERLLGSPMRATWLYLAHELVHQWLGNTVRFADGTRATWEAWVDAVTWHLAERCAGAGVGRAYRTVFERYVDVGGELGERGRLVLACRRRLDLGEVRLTDLCPPTRSGNEREERAAC